MDNTDEQQRKRVRMECAFGHLTLATGAEGERPQNDPPARHLGVSSDAAAPSVHGGDVRNDVPVVTRRPRARWPELVSGRERLAGA